MVELIFVAIGAIILAYVIFIFFTKKGRNIMFGGEIIKTFDSIESKRRIFTGRIKVHSVQAAPSVRMVGFEISQSSFGSYQMMPLTLPAREAKELANMINEAIEYDPRTET